MAESSSADDNLPNLVFGDSWFLSVKTVVQLKIRGQESVGPVKQSHNGYPKAFMNEHLGDAPGGVKLVMKGTHPSGINLVATGYKYSSKRVLTFISSEGAGSTTNGNPYEMKYTDE